MPRAGYPNTATNKREKNTTTLEQEEAKEMEVHDDENPFAYLTSCRRPLLYGDSPVIEPVMEPVDFQMAIPLEEQLPSTIEHTKILSQNKAKCTIKYGSSDVLSAPRQVDPTTHPLSASGQPNHPHLHTVSIGSRVKMSSRGWDGTVTTNMNKKDSFQAVFRNHGTQVLVSCPDSMDNNGQFSVKNNTTASSMPTGVDIQIDDEAIGGTLPPLSISDPVQIASEQDKGLKGIVKSNGKRKGLFNVEFRNVVLPKAKDRKSLELLEARGTNREFAIGDRVRITSKQHHGVVGIVNSKGKTKNLFFVKCEVFVLSKERTSLKMLLDAREVRGTQRDPPTTSPSIASDANFSSRLEPQPTSSSAPDEASRGPNRILTNSPQKQPTTEDPDSTSRKSREPHFVSKQTNIPAETNLSSEPESRHTSEASPRDDSNPMDSPQGQPSASARKTHESTLTSTQTEQKAPAGVNNQGNRKTGQNYGTRKNRGKGRNNSSSTTIFSQPDPNVSDDSVSPSCPWLVRGALVKVTKGKRATGENGEQTRGKVTRVTPCRASIITEDGREYKLLSHSSLRPLAPHDSANDEMKVVGFNSEPEKEGNLFVVNRHLSADAPKQENTLLSHLFGNRIRKITLHFDPNSDNTAPPTLSVVRDSVYEFVATRFRKDESPGRFSSKTKRVDCYYVKASGPDVEPIDLQQELDRYAGFSTLSPYKIAARMDLLTSPGVNFPADPSITQHSSSVFKMIPESDEYEGCGFISEQLLKELVVDRDLDGVTGVQVRILVPLHGLFKGELMRKRHMDGDHHIELNTSMLKAGPSMHQDFHNWGLVSIRQVQPSQTNLCLGKLLNPTDNWKPTKSFQEKIKPLSKMIIPFLEQMGVPRDILKDYVKHARQPLDLRHAWVVGMADPTGSLPPGHIFVPGFKGTVELEKICITRSPCREPGDVRMLPLVCQRPTGMKQEHWNELNDLPFGSVIFANPKPGTKSLPFYVANEDLDGDLYFICWDIIVLSHLVAEPVPEEPLSDDDDEPNESSGGAGKDWLVKAQTAMVENAFNYFPLQQLQGRLYKLSEKIGLESDEGVSHPDAIAFGRAYKNVLDYPKHRRPIVLAAHLWDKIPPKLHKYLTTNEESSSSGDD